MCGENAAVGARKLSKEGSPPRVRGKPLRLPQPDSALGITPACAGKTDPARDSRLDAQDHPRVCGENSLGRSSRCLPSGSPPRVRGKRAALEGRSERDRITPACAGKTIRCREGYSSAKDHPRVCGENKYVINADRMAARITPACAGKTLQLVKRLQMP